MKDITLRLKECLSEISLGEPIQIGESAIFPLLGGSENESPFILSGPAIEAGTVEVTEINEGGSVPELLVTNHGNKPVLFPEGEILIGAKQNRVVNLTVLIPAEANFRLPVSCVEQGRWFFKSRGFRSGPRATPDIREAKQRSVLRSRRETGEARSDQGEVWERVDDSLRMAACMSSTMDFCEGIEKERKERGSSEPIPELPQDARGIIAIRGDRVVGMDLFDSPETFSRLKERLVEAYIFGQGREEKPSEMPVARIADDFLTKVALSARSSDKPIGLGEQIEIESSDLVGTGLWYEDRPCHIAAFGTR